jgi:hypothetical protein
VTNAHVAGIGDDVLREAAADAHGAQERGDHAAENEAPP